jgi:hypothetical protein
MPRVSKYVQVISMAFEPLEIEGGITLIIKFKVFIS